MKKILCLLLAVTMLLVNALALAEVPTITQGKLLFAQYVNGEQQTWSAKTEHSAAKMLYEFVLNTAANVKASIYEKNSNALYTGVHSAQETAGKITLWWNGVNTEGWHPDAGKSIELVLKIQAENEEGTAKAEHVFGFVSAHNMSEHEEIVIPPVNYDPLNPSEEPEAPIEPQEFDSGIYGESQTVIYSHNTVCSFGPHFRDISPELTDKWYMFTPIDLSQNGRQVYEMVGGNAYVIGSVTIDVNGDEVVVNYDYNDGVYAYDEFYTFFSDYDSVTTVDPQEIETSYEYGQKLSIANDLGGDTDVLLFTCNTATFKSDNKAISRFYENIEWRKALREGMLEMIGMADAAK